MSMKGIILVFVTLTALSVTQGTWRKAEVCYEKYGCFGKQPPWKTPWLLYPWLLIHFPAQPSRVGTSFHMFTREGYGIVNDNDQSQLEAPNFNISRRTIFVIHGFTENRKTWPSRIKNALLNREDCNVVLVDWSRGALPPYGQAAGNTQLVGAQVAELIRFLISSSSGSPDLAERFYIVGFSLGAQIAGFAGAYLKDRGMTLGRITGLDPAGPGFTNADPNFRLDPKDAAYVDVVHTDGATLGTDQIVGVTDFFPNGGHNQPGCVEIKLPVFKILLMVTATCDHLRAPEYYIATVQNPSAWIASPCLSFFDCTYGKYRPCVVNCPTMGYGADNTKIEGNFYLKTNSKAPFRRIE